MNRGTCCSIGVRFQREFWPSRGLKTEEEFDARGASNGAVMPLEPGQFM